MGIATPCSGQNVAFTSKMRRCKRKNKRSLFFLAWQKRTMAIKRFIIMADGKMKRWNNHQVPKHLLPVHGEPILLRTARLAQRYAPEAQVIITSHNPDYEAPGAVRYEPKSNSCEIDRFTWELIDDDVCFLYGDVYYTEQAIRRIVEMPVKSLGFARNDTEVFAVKVADGAYQKACIRKLKEKDPACRGWQLYEMAQRDGCAEICRIEDETTGFNTEEEYRRFAEKANC